MVAGVRAEAIRAGLADAVGFDAGIKALLRTAGPAQALAATGAGRYEVTLVSLSGGVVATNCPGVSFDSVARRLVDRVDTSFIPGGRDAPTAAEEADLVDLVGQLAAGAGRIACVCTGALLAAEAGLLTGRHAATHCDIRTSSGLKGE